MKKTENIGTDELFEEILGDDYLDILGLNKIPGLNEKDDISKKSEKNVKKCKVSKDDIFVSDEEWEKGAFPLPTF